MLYYDSHVSIKSFSRLFAIYETLRRVCLEPPAARLGVDLGPAAWHQAEGREEGTGDPAPQRIGGRGAWR